MKKTLLEALVKEATTKTIDELAKEDRTIDFAKEIFKDIKAIEKVDGNELSAAVADLKTIFDINALEIKSWRKTKVFLEHQSQMVNAIYMELNNR